MWSDEETQLVNEWYYDIFNEECDLAYTDLEYQPTANDFEKIVWDDLKMSSMPMGLAYTILNKSLSKVNWQELVDHHIIADLSE